MCSTHGVLLLCATFVWGLVLLVCFIGWGGSLRRLLSLAPTATWAEEAALGLALSTCLGGPLNLAGLISPWTVQVWVVAGVVNALWWAAVLKTPSFLRAPQSLSNILATLGIVSLSLTFYAGTLAAYGFDAFGGGMNGHDDAHAYLVFPHQMLQVGRMVEDPFNERLMISSLGGQSFLQTLVLAVLPDESLKMLDPGLAWLLCVGLVSMDMRSLRARWPSVAVVLSVLFLVRFPIVNLTSLGTSLMALLALPLLVLRWTDPQAPVKSGCLVALLAVGAALLKSLNIPSVGLLLLLYYAWRLCVSPVRRNVWLELGVAVAVSLLLLAPGMISMFRATGTPLYPLLGTGNASGGSQLVAAERPWGELLGNLCHEPDIVVLLVLAAINAVLLPWRSKEWALTLASALAALVTAAALGRVFQGHHPRYHFAAVTAAIILSAMFTVGSSWLRDVGVALLLVWYAPRFAPDIAYKPLPHWEQLDAALQGRGRLSERESTYRALQAAALPGARLLVRLDSPSVLDFGRNPIWTIDLPCGVGVPPGLPCRASLKKVVQYLMDSGVEYVAYSYENSASYSERGFRHYLTSRDPLMRLQSKRVFRFNKKLEAMGRCYERVFDDGQRWLVHLTSGPCQRKGRRPRRRSSPN